MLNQGKLLVVGLLLWLPAQAELLPASGAQAMQGSHVRNFYQVDVGVYRSEQPDRTGFIELQQRGVRSVLNLRAYHRDDTAAAGTTLTLLHVPTHTAVISYAQLVTAVAMMRQAEKPVLVHCMHGSDRTGAVIAAYRVAEQGWTPAQAADELQQGGFGYHAMFGNIPPLIRQLDANRLRADVAQRAAQLSNFKG